VKICTGCKRELEYSNFFRLKKSPDGYDWRCKDCDRAYKKEWLSRSGVWEKRRESLKQYARNNPQMVKAAHIKWAYGLTAEEHEALWTKQNNMCAICGILLTSDTAEVDHDHATGAVRGLLCRMCNQLLGRARDDKTILAAAIKYLGG